MANQIFEIVGWAIIAGLAVGAFLITVMGILTGGAWLFGWRND